MHRLLYIGLFFFFLQSCTKVSESSQTLFHPLPEGADIVISTTDMQNTQLYLDDLRLFGLKNTYDEKLLAALDSIDIDDMSVGFYRSQDETSFLVSGKASTAQDSIVHSTSAKSLERVVLDSSGTSIIRTIDNGLVLISNDSLLIGESRDLNDSLLTSLSKVERRNKGVDILVNRPNYLIPFAFIERPDTIQMNSRTFFSINGDEAQLNYTGVLMSKDSLFKNLSTPLSSQVLDFIPTGASKWQILGLEQPLDSTYTKDVPQVEMTDSIPDLTTYSSEMGCFKKRESSFFVFHLNRSAQLREVLNLSDPIEEFRDTEIYNYAWSSSLVPRLEFLFESTETSYLAITQNFLVLSNSVAGLRDALSSFYNNDTVVNSEMYTQLSAELRTSFSYMAYGNEDMISSLVNETTLGYNSSFFQISKDKDFVHINGLLADYKKIKNAKPVEEVFTVNIDKELLSAPQWVTNHLTGAKDILVQDVENYLYLISNNGKIYWKKRLNGAILGKVEQIDMYKNGRLQLAFCTASRLYVLDRNGNNVSPFPKNFRDEITQPLAVFDYDNNRNYRLLISQGNELLMLNAKGKRISGFNYKGTKQISSRPTHFRIGRKDYIVFKTQQQIKILNRKGQNRISVAERIDFSDNDIYLYQNQFTSTNKAGELVQIDEKGKLRTQNLNLTEDHRMVSTSKTLVTQTENKLNIKLKSVDLDYGIYSDPQIFYLNDKIYIATTDQQSKQLFLYDSQAKPIKGFPVFGTSSASLANADNSRGLEMVVQTDTRSISVFRLQ